MVTQSAVFVSMYINLLIFVKTKASCFITRIELHFKMHYILKSWGKIYGFKLKAHTHCR